MNPQKPKTKIKMRNVKKYKVEYCVICRSGYRSSETIRSMKAFRQSLGNSEERSQDTAMSSHELPMEPRAEGTWIVISA